MNSLCKYKHIAELENERPRKRLNLRRTLTVCCQLVQNHERLAQRHIQPTRQFTWLQIRFLTQHHVPYVGFVARVHHRGMHRVNEHEPEFLLRKFLQVHREHQVLLSGWGYSVYRNSSDWQRTGNVTSPYRFMHRAIIRLQLYRVFQHAIESEINQYDPTPLLGFCILFQIDSKYASCPEQSGTFRAVK
jgi:hypothetical protein